MFRRKECIVFGFDALAIVDYFDALEAEFSKTHLDLGRACIDTIFYQLLQGRGRVQNNLKWTEPAQKLQGSHWRLAQASEGGQDAWG